MPDVFTPAQRSEAVETRKAECGTRRRSGKAGVAAGRG